MADVLKELEEKISKLWKLLEEHNNAIPKLLEKQKKAMNERDIDSVGELAGMLVVIGQSDVCYATAIEILEDLKKGEPQVGG